MAEARSLYRSPAWWVLGLLLLLLVPSMLNAPFGRDQGIFAWVASVMLDAGAPYSDAWDIKGPLVYYVYAAGMWLSDGQGWGVFSFDLILLTISLIVLFRTSLARAQPQLACAIGVIMLGSGMTTYFNAGQPDTWCAYMAIICACLVMVPEGQNLRLRAGICGVLVGLMCLNKPNYIVFMPVIAAALLINNRQKFMPLIICGLCSVLTLAMGIWGIYLLGGGEGLRDAVRFVLEQHSSSYGIGYGLLALFWPADLYEIIRLIFILATFAGLGLVYKQDNKAGLLWAGFLLAALLVYLSQGKLVRYHFFPFFAVGAVLVGYALMHTAQKIKHAETKRWATVGLVVYGGAVISTLTGFYPNGAQRWRDCFFAAQPANLCLERYVIDDMRASDMAAAANYIRANSTANDRIYLWGTDAGIYVTADRKSASALGYSYPMVLGVSGDRYRLQLMRDLAVTPPKFIIVGLADANPVTDPEGFLAASGYKPRDSVDILPMFPELNQLIHSQYTSVYANAALRVYGRISP